MANKFKAVMKRDGKWWIGWIEEVPGVNCQERTREKLLASLRTTLAEALDFNRREAIQDRRSSVPRHREISDNLARKICRDLGIPFIR
jgi:hypothetical protein